MAKCLKTILLLYFLNFRFEMVKSEDVEVEQENNKILDETALKPGQFPFLVKIISGNGKFRCSGTFVSPVKVLTLAECLLDNKAEFVVPASADTKTKGQRRKIIKYVVHPKYIKFVRIFKKRNRGNDLGMATARALDVLENPAWIALAREVTLRNGTVIAGNGLDVTINDGVVKPKSSRTRKTKCVDDGRIHFSTYEVQYKNTGLHEDSPLFVSRAKDPKKVICGSDSGGPLITKDRPHLLIGVHFETHDMESYDISVVDEDNRKWILSQLEDKPKLRNLSTFGL